MRVIGGSAKGRKLLPVPGDSTRPILDRVKTSLFDILRPILPGLRILDLFGGSGAVGIEALSQGAEHCTFVEIEKKAIQTIEKNLTSTGLSSQASVRSNDSFRFLKSCTDSFDLIYVAPPQYKGMWIQAMHLIAERPDLVAAGGSVVVQIDPVEDENISLTLFERSDERRYGSTLLVFYKKIAHRQ